MTHIYIRKKKNEPDILFEKLNSYHWNIKLTVEKNSMKFLDTKIIYIWIVKLHLVYLGKLLYAVFMK